MKNLLIVAMLLFSSASFAAGNFTITPGGDLTKEQQAQLQLQAAKMASENSEVPKPPVQPKELTEWVNFGKAIGSGLAGTAQELGVAADKIADTRVGAFAMILIAWHYVGAELVSIVFGFAWLSVLIPIWVWMYRRQFIIQSIAWYEKDKREDGVKKVVTFRDYYDKEDGLRVMYWITLLFITFVGVLPILF